MTDSSLADPRETPSASSTQTPPYPEPGTASDPTRPASSGARKPSRSRKKTTAKRSRKAPSRSRAPRVKDDPNKAAPPPPPKKLDDAPPPVPPVTPEQVKKLLKRGGEALHYAGCFAIGVDERDYPDLFMFDQAELDGLAEPTLNVAKKSRLMMAVLERFDPALLILSLFRYLMRTASEAREAIDDYNKQLVREVRSDRDRETATAAAAGAAAAGEVVAKVREIPVVPPPGRGLGGRAPVAGPGAIQGDVGLDDETPG